VADRAAAAKGYAARFGATIATTDIEQVLKDERVQLVVVTSRHSEHVPVVTRALLAGKHVFVEKPMAVTLEGCRQILEAEHQSKGAVCVGFNRRYAPVYRTAKQLLSERVGPVLINFMMNAPWVNTTKWIHALEEGGGAIVSEGVHFFDLFCWLTDEEPIMISAAGLKAHIPSNIDRNNVSMTLRLSRGSLANLIYTTHGHVRGVQERLEIRTGGRTIIAEDMKRLSVQGKLLKGIRRLIPARGHRELFNDFVASLQTGSPSPVPARDGARATVLAIKALLSIETEQTIPVSIDEYT
jgi:predicted dehydrogenase